MWFWTFLGRALVGSAGGQILTAVSVGLVALWGYGAWQHRQGHREGAKEGAAQVVETVNTQAEEQVEQALEAREPAKLPGAVDRLRKEWCRDCSR
jgi:citrate synthase